MSLTFTQEGMEGHGQVAEGRDGGQTPQASVLLGDRSPRLLPDCEHPTALREPRCLQQVSLQARRCPLVPRAPGRKLLRLCLRAGGGICSPNRTGP